MGKHEEPPPTYGPTALATPANFVTVARILATPVFVLLIATQESSWLTFAIGFAIGMSDFVDGWLARRQGATRSGAFLDPLADKVLVLGGMFALVANGQFHWVPVAIIAVRELVISAYRSQVGRRGISVPATKMAKWKTFVQLWAIGFGVIPPIAESAHWVATATLWIAVLMTVQTGVAYLAGARRIAKAQLGKDV
ncbi:MAG TPA: CDP-diacylglycerol--glycerol-3-phosphate 3-phosphatidyltransferase [Acidimicrobiaceae bacterium]|nr:CDP-diacylglycerol--glycerol-3-phosphate 3-phosphatidyltransferase [Acidimicrobiaceae bacterium]HBU38913.1 CDP-diacylglycerol--glycerol-3-phosphate 3-phosphatidyltransferase [Acidimicrobiaceae bacterium]|tara:strand:- start:3935 stop:4522 length:588 start_codon:yes stop_codon:yes gene_type:complete